MKIILLFFLISSFQVFSQVYISPEIEVLTYSKKQDRISYFLNNHIDQKKLELIHNEYLKFIEKYIHKQVVFQDFYSNVYNLVKVEIPAWYSKSETEKHHAKIKELRSILFSSEDLFDSYAKQEIKVLEKHLSSMKPFELLRDTYLLYLSIDSPDEDIELIKHYLRSKAGKVIKALNYSELSSIYLLNNTMYKVIQYGAIQELITKKKFPELYRYFKNQLNEDEFIFKLNKSFLPRLKKTRFSINDYIVKKDFTLFEITPPFPRLKLQLNDAISYESVINETLKEIHPENINHINPHYHVSILKEKSAFTDNEFKKLTTLYKTMNATAINHYRQHSLPDYPLQYKVFGTSINSYGIDLKSDKKNVILIEDPLYHHLEIRNLSRIHTDERRAILKEIDHILRQDSYEKASSFIVNNIFKYLEHSVINQIENIFTGQSMTMKASATLYLSIVLDPSYIGRGYSKLLHNQKFLKLIKSILKKSDITGELKNKASRFIEHSKKHNPCDGIFNPIR